MYSFQNIILLNATLRSVIWFNVSLLNAIPADVVEPTTQKKGNQVVDYYWTFHSMIVLWYFPAPISAHHLGLLISNSLAAT